jgi:DNA-binding HxlR family transcriptional regulator
MARTYKKVMYSPKGKDHELTPTSAAQGVEDALKVLEGRWKLVILFHLFGGNVLRFSELERAIPAISQKMLIQQLRQMEADGIVRRVVYHQVPPKVEYCLTEWGQALCPALDALLKWAAQQPGTLQRSAPSRTKRGRPSRKGPLDSSGEKKRLPDPLEYSGKELSIREGSAE